jgi:hypothetical protein
MKELILALTMLAAFAAASDDVAAQMPCPQEIETAKQMLKSYLAAHPAKPPRSAAAARQDVQAPRSQEIQAPRDKSQEIQAPRSQEIQAPRDKSQEIQAPRSQQEIQAPRSQEIQAPRDKSQEIQAPRRKQVQAPRAAKGKDVVARSRALIRDADAACKRGDTATATQKATAAIELLEAAGMPKP